MSPEPGVGPVRRADGLGFASAALGAAMLFAPRRLLRASGIRRDARSTATMMVVGLRELAATATILGMRHRRIGCWSRVAGDTMDMALLGIAFGRRREHAFRLLGATGLIAAILAADLITALQLNEAEGVGVEDGSSSHGVGAEEDEQDAGPAHVRTAITILAPEDRVREAADRFEWTVFRLRDLEDAGKAWFAQAPGDRGTELHVNYEPPVPGGRFVGPALKLGGVSPDQKINEDLRRFKALIETGVEVRSDKTPESFSARRQILQRPGQPPAGAERRSEQPVGGA